ncbi:cytoskeletal protein binding protein [Sporothrix epigloea]|uniref:Actin cytoskeleton-regulatory complex protein SLA1 n=1 Tax=Sporothrix epigloea TaxID=1892477 RepID=A0ABP0DCI3_9PEZI
MGFIGVYKAIYDYTPQSESELAISEGSLLYILDKEGGDGWWKAKKKATGDDEDEPEGLIPENYIEEAKPIRNARALYEYTRQTDEELSFPEEAQLAIYDISDPDWILAGYENEYGFAPANYIDLDDTGVAAVEEDDEDDDPLATANDTPPPALPTRQAYIEDDEDVQSPRLPARGQTDHSSPTANSSAAAALANVLASRSAQRPVTPPPSLPDRPRYLSDDASEGDDPLSPPLPTRPRPRAHFEEAQSSPTLPHRSNTISHSDYSAGSESRNGGYDADSLSNNVPPGGYHLYNISEMVSVMGKRKKMPTTLGINLKTGVILIAPERSQDGPSQEWSADKMTHYSREGKHVFMELVKPSKSVDFHAGAKDTAEEIVSALGELAGAVRAEGLREVILAGTGHELKTAVVLYDFTAQGDDEVTVAVGDEVIVLDDRRSEEWCQVRRVKNGKEGAVPLSYVEVTGTMSSDIPPQPVSGHHSSAPTSPTTDSHPTISTAVATIGARSTVKQNRLDEERLTRDAVRAAVRDESRRTSEQQRKENGRSNGNGSGSRPGKSKPDASKVRTWTDRTKSFSVDAQFLGLKDGKINLHKLNGVKIAVPVAKMSLEDLEYVESKTGVSLDEDKPLSSMKRKSQIQQQNEVQASPVTKAGASIEPSKPEYDWFQFFLGCDVAVGLCERYAQAFVKDSMDESVLPDIHAGNLRTLGLREGDIIKVMRFLDEKYGRSKNAGEDGGENAGGLFSGPGGALRNNTRRGRPTPTTQASDVVDARAFAQPSPGDDSRTNRIASPVAPVAPAKSVSPLQPAAATGSSGFDDDAWDVKPSRQPAPQAADLPAARRTTEPVSAPAPPIVPQSTASLTGSMQELSMLTQPLTAERLNPNPPPPITLSAQATPAVSLPSIQQQQQQATSQLPGATPGLFAGLAQQQTGIQDMNGLQPQQTAAYARARPVAPQHTQGQGGLLPPPPARPLSAPQSAQPSAFSPPPLQPQMTGMVTGQVAPMGQSLNEIALQRMQQQYQQQMMQQQMLAQQQTQPMMSMMTGMPMMQQPQQTGFGMPGQFMPQQQNQFGSPMQMQPTGFPGQYNPGQQQFGMAPPNGANLNSILPPALEPQRTAMPAPQPMQPQPTGPFTRGFGNHNMPPAPAPLMPQQTGPPPPVRFGVSEETRKLMPQPTGRRANLFAATPENPFGF